MRNICISQQQLNFFIKRLNDEEKAELMFTLTESDGGFQIKWVAESITKRRNYSESRRNNRKKPNKKNGLSYENHMKTYDEHMDNEIEIENEDINKEKKKGVTGERKNKPEPLNFPFSSPEFMESWKILISTSKWKKKIPHSLQLALNSLGRYQEEFAIQLINKAIENGWQGVTYPDTDEQYQKWLNGHSKIRTADNSNRKNTAGYNAEDKKRSVSDLAEMAEGVLQNLVPENIQ